MEKLKFKECENCKEWTGWMTYCMDNCGKPLDALEEFNKYKILEEQGRLLELPCAVDDEVWYIDKYGDLYTEIVRGVVAGYSWYRSCGFALDIVWDKPIMGHFGYKRKEMPFSEVGKTIFLTQREAEAVLEKSLGGNDEGSDKVSRE